MTENETLRWDDGPSALELASEALGRHDYGAAIAADPTLTDTGTIGRRLYAAALVGRAGRLMTQSPSEAQQLISTAIEYDLARADAYVIRGKLYTRSKAYDRAVEAYRQAVALDPESTDALFNLGYIYASAGRPADAEAMLRRVVALKPAYLDKALFNLAVVQQQLGRVDESIETLETAIAADMENDRIRHFMNQLKGRSR